ASHERRSAHMAELLAIVSEWFAARDFDAAVKELQAHDIPHSPLMSMADIFADPHYRARESIIDVPSEVGPLPQPAVIPRLSATPGAWPPGGPPLGFHTEEVLGGLLGMSEAEIATLRNERVV